tara:strand:- start:6 stop:554 length:549 start_codon:yes stop_codon:yes gene_type:complete
MRKTQQEQVGHILGYGGALVLFLRFIPLLYEQITKPREINLYFLYLEMLASILCGLSAILLEAFPLFVANALSCLCVLIVLVIQYRIRINKKKNLKTQNKEEETKEDEDTIVENTLTNQPQKNKEIKNAAKNSSTRDLISTSEKYLKESTSKREKKTSFVPLYELETLDEPEQLTEVYNVIH